MMIGEEKNMKTKRLKAEILKNDSKIAFLIFIVRKWRINFGQ